MKIACPYCQYENEAANNLCRHCGKNLDFNEEQIGIRQLKLQLLDIKQKFDVQYHNISGRVEVAEKQLAFLQKKQEYLHSLAINLPQTKQVANEIKPEIKQELVLPIEKVQPVELPPIKELTEEELKEKLRIEQEKAFREHEEQKRKAKQEKEKREQNEEKYKQERAYKQERENQQKQKEQERRQKQEAQAAFWADVRGFVETTFIGTFFAPLAQFWSYLTDLYAHYKEQDKLPVFFMTIGGLLAILFGFGYLMQFISDSAFEIMKIAGTLASSIGLIIWGIYLQKRQQKYHDFGSALQGLGISLNFLLVYFLSYSLTFPFFNSYAVGIVLMILNTAIACFLAFRYETKIVLMITLFGGGFAPFYLNSNIISVFYFIYLWVLCLVTVLIALQIKWKTAGTLAFLVSTIVFEAVILTSFRQFLPSGTLAILVMAFAYLFFYFALFENKDKNNLSIANFGLKENLDANDIFNLAGNAALLVANLYNIYEGGQNILLRTLGFVYLFNAVLFVVGFFVFRKKLTPKMQFLFMIIAGAFLGFAVPQLFNQNIAGLFWSIEGLALVLCGFIFGLVDVRKEGYFLLLLGIGKLVITFGDIPQNWLLVLWTDGYVNLLSCGLVLLLTKILLDKYATQRTKYEKNLAYFTLEALSFWFLAAFWIAARFYSPVWSFNLAILLVYAYIAWAYRNRLPFTMWLGFIHLGVLLWAYLVSAIIAGDLAFRFQTTSAKVAMIEFALSLWFLQLFYQKILPLIPQIAAETEDEKQEKTTRNAKEKQAETSTTSLATTLLFRELFYLALPIFFLSSVYRFNAQYLPFALWTSVLVAFAVAEITKKKAVAFEWNILVPIALYVLLVFPQSAQLILPFSAAYLFKVSLVSTIYGSIILFGILLYSRFYKRKDLKTNAVRDEVTALLQYDLSSFWVSLLMLATTFRFYPDYLPLVAWAAVLLNFVVAEINQKKLDKVEIHVLIGFATYMLVISAFGQAFDNPNPVLQKITIGSAVAGLVVLFGILLYKKGLQIAPPKTGKDEMAIFDYQVVHAYSFYFLGLVIFLGTLQFSRNFTAAWCIVAAYFAVLVILREKLLPLQSNYKFAYRIGHFAAVFGLFVLYSFAIWLNRLDSMPNQPFAMAAALLMLPFYYWLVYNREQYPMKNNAWAWLVDLFAVHLATAVAYASLLTMIFGRADTIWLTIAFTLHAIILLFNGTSKHYKQLIKLSVVFFGFALLKLFLQDLANASVPQKVMVFMGIGVLMLGGSFLFMRFKEKE
jgi:hypothetical protein